MRLRCASAEVFDEETGHCRSPEFVKSCLGLTTTTVIAIPQNDGGINAENEIGGLESMAEDDMSIEMPRRGKCQYCGY